MKRIATSCVLALSTATVLASGGPALSQQKTLMEQIVGTWTFVSTSALLPDGRSVWGNEPKGQLIFTPNGRFSVQVVRSDLPKFASNNRLNATPEEHKAAVEGSIALFGTYTIDEAERLITLKPEASTYPNWTGVSQKRIIISVSAEQLVYANPATSRGGATSVTWRRAR